MMKIKIISAIAIAPLLAHCGFEPTSAEYDQLRYDQLQKADCPQIAKLGSKELIVERPDEYTEVLARCEQMQALSFEDYQRASSYAREHGEWDVDAALGRKSD